MNPFPFGHTVVLTTSAARETLDDGWFDPAERAAEEPLGYPAHLREIYSLGDRVIRMCFDDPAIPAFGMYATE